MGIVISRAQLSPQSGSLKPLIFVDPDEALAKNAISLSLPLAEALSNASPKMRTIKMESFLLSAIKDQDKPLIKDIDVLFNPAYEVDILLMLRNACKKKEFSVIWPGVYRDGYLYYAEHGYTDYKAYNLNNYDVTVII